MIRGILFFSAFFAFMQISFADVLTLNNGYVFKGELISKTDKNVVFKTDFGEIKADLNSVSKLDVETKREAVLVSSNAKPKVEEPKKEEKIKEPEFNLEKYLQSYREFVHSNVPKGWEFRIAGAVERRNTNSSTNAYRVSFNAKKTWENSSEFFFNAYYDYAVEKNSLGGKYRTTDKYGAITNYKYFFSGTSWFATNTLAYSADTIANIDDQVDEIIGIGRKFKFFDDTLLINISIGPAIRYVNARNYDDHWLPMGTFVQDFSWQLHKYLRAEQSLYTGGVMFAGVGLSDVSKYNYVVNLGLVFKLTEVMDIAMRYFYSYNNVNSPSAQKEEERILLSFELPLK